MIFSTMANAIWLASTRAARLGFDFFFAAGKIITAKVWGPKIGCPVWPWASFQNGLRPSRVERLDQMEAPQ